MKSLLDSLPWDPETDNMWAAADFYHHGVEAGWVTNQGPNGYIIGLYGADRNRWEGLDPLTAECILIELNIDDPRERSKPPRKVTDP